MRSSAFLLGLVSLISLSVSITKAATPASSAKSAAAAEHWTADNGNGTYSNPLFYEEFEDPDVIRVAVGSTEPICIDNTPAQVALFRYDNNTFKVQNYLPESAEVTISVTGTASQIHDLLTGQYILPAQAVGRGFGQRCGFGGRGPSGPLPRTSFTFTVLPQSYMAFAVIKDSASSNTIN
jgi:hypothetical protein